MMRKRVLGLQQVSLYFAVFVSVATFGLLWAGAAVAQACTNNLCSTVQVTGSRVGGGTIVCRGSECAEVLFGLQSRVLELWDGEFPLDQADVPVSKDEFCRSLKSSKPAGCSTASNQAPVPGLGISSGLYASMFSNGCGTGSTFESLVAVSLETSGLVNNFSGDRNAPIASQPTFSFRNDCNAHDACYAGQLGQSQCDSAFASDMLNSCSAAFGAYSSDAASCQAFARLYSGLVGSLGHHAYTASEARMACSLWNQNMNANACPK